MSDGCVLLAEVVEEQVVVVWQVAERDEQAEAERASGRMPAARRGGEQVAAPQQRDQVHAVAALSQRPAGQGAQVGAVGWRRSACSPGCRTAPCPASPRRPGSPSPHCCSAARENRGSGTARSKTAATAGKERRTGREKEERARPTSRTRRRERREWERARAQRCCCWLLPPPPRPAPQQWPSRP